MRRLPPQPGERIVRDRPLAFTFDGARVVGFEGDTVGSALAAADRGRVGYQRRFGLVAGSDRVTVGGRPGVPAALEPLRAGMRVERTGGRAAGRSLRPPWWWRVRVPGRLRRPPIEPGARERGRLGLPAREAAAARADERPGPAPGVPAERAWRTEHRCRHADVLVVGGGAAGLSAAIAAARAGADVVLADEGLEAGGRLLAEGGHRRAAELTAQARAAGVEVLERAVALGCFGGPVAVWQDATLHEVRARALVLATGAVEQPLVFARNELPGILPSGAARALVARFAVAPGDRAVVVTTGDRGLEAAVALRRAGGAVAAIADLRPEPSALAQTLGAELPGTELLLGHTVWEARGSRHVTGAVLGPVDRLSGERTVACDVLVIAGGDAPAAALAVQAGARTAYDARRGHFVLTDLPPGVYAAGDLAGEGAGEAGWPGAGAGSVRAGAASVAELSGALAGAASVAELSGALAGAASVAELSGALAGAAAAHGVGLGDGPSDVACERLRALAAQAPPVAVPPVVSGADRGRCFVDLDREVTVEAARRAVAAGARAPDARHAPLARLIAQETGVDLATVEPATPGPPLTPVPMGVLAGRPLAPVRRSAVDGRQRELGATVGWAGDWRRAADYGDPPGEALALHEHGGVIDVSAIGKLLVHGPDAGAFLDRLSPRRLSTLAPGRVRYALLTDEAGRIVDDGTICRLDDGDFFLTTSAGGGEAWLARWIAAWRLDVGLTDLGQALTALRLAGPRAHDVMAELNAPDCGEDLAAREIPVAGVPCLVIRDDLTGYAIHGPAVHGEHLWDAILDAGEPYGVRPVGAEAERVLRLEALRILVGQDTDAGTTPFASGLAWAVELDREDDFVGRRALEDHARRAPDALLVGFSLPAGRVPAEGAVVLGEGGRPAGRVTSSRSSAHLRRVIGLAWVPAPLAAEGATITIADGDWRYDATVRTRPWHDPSGVAAPS